jgi:hypothetical protein
VDNGGNAAVAASWEPGPRARRQARASLREAKQQSRPRDERILREQSCERSRSGRTLGRPRSGHSGLSLATPLLRLRSTRSSSTPSALVETDEARLLRPWCHRSPSDSHDGSHTGAMWRPLGGTPLSLLSFAWFCRGSPACCADCVTECAGIGTAWCRECLVCCAGHREATSITTKEPQVRRDRRDCEGPRISPFRRAR